MRHEQLIQTESQLSQCHVTELTGGSSVGVICCTGTQQWTMSFNDCINNRLQLTAQQQWPAIVNNSNNRNAAAATTSANEDWHKDVLTASLPGCVFTRRSLVLAASRSNLSDSRVFFSFCQVTQSPAPFTQLQHLISRCITIPATASHNTTLCLKKKGPPWNSL